MDGAPQSTGQECPSHLRASSPSVVSGPAWQLGGAGGWAAALRPGTRSCLALGGGPWPAVQAEAVSPTLSPHTHLPAPQPATPPAQLSWGHRASGCSPDTPRAAGSWQISGFLGFLPVLAVSFVPPQDLR